MFYTNYPKTQDLLITKFIGDYNEEHVLTKQSYPENTNPVFEFRVYVETTEADGNTKLVPYSYAPYYLTKIVDGQKHYFTLDKGDNNEPNDHGTTVTVCSRTGRSGSINSIPPEYTIEIPNLLVGTHFYVEERRDNIPEGYEYVVEDLVETTYGEATLTDIDRLVARDENDKQSFDPETVGKIIEGVDAETHVWNKYNPFKITVKKNWEGTIQDSAVITVKVKRYKLIDKVGSLSVIPDVSANGYDFQATYSVYGPKGELIGTFSDGQRHDFTDLKVGRYTVTETLSKADPTMGYTITHAPEFESGYMTHSQIVTVTENEPVEATFTSTYTPKYGYLNITKTVSGVPAGFSFDATYTVTRNSDGATVATYTYAELPVQNLKLPEGDYTVAENGVVAKPNQHQEQHSNQSVSVQVREGDSQTAAFSTTYKKGAKVNVNVTYDNGSNITGGGTYYAGDTINFSITTYGHREIKVNVNGAQVADLTKNPGEQYDVTISYSYTIPENASENTNYNINFTNPWWAIRSISYSKQDADSQSSSAVASAMTLQRNTTLRNTQINDINGVDDAEVVKKASRPATAAKPTVPASLAASKMYAVDPDFEIEITLSNGTWSRMIEENEEGSPLEARDADGNLYYYFISSVEETGIHADTELILGNELISAETAEDARILTLKNKWAEPDPVVTTITINKVIRGTSTPLVGAKFKLTKVIDTTGKLPAEEDRWCQELEVTNSETGSITFTGVYPGLYMLEETLIPGKW